MGWTRGVAFGLGIAIFIVACGDDDGIVEPDASTVLCIADEDCSDELFCNGQESCAPDSPDADALGCVSGVGPCAGAECDEVDRACVEGTCEDSDGDGHQDAACGGDDCDDTDANRFPGNPEVCDSAGHDDDCDPSTLGPDADTDGYVDESCCNLQSDGALRCGLDCNDASQAINPEAVDACGNGDEDCDGDIDEEPELIFFRDIDGDGYGIPGDTVMACGAPGGYALLSTDCNDMIASHNPGAREICELEPGETPDPVMHDQDCDGAVDEGCACPIGATQACGSVLARSGVGRCRAGTQDCDEIVGGTAWGACSAMEPVDELCNNEDDDCDGDSDETFQCPRGELIFGTNACGTSASRQCGSDCVWADPAFGTPEIAATCNYCDDTGTGVNGELPYATTDVTLELTATGRILEGVATEFGDNYDVVASQRDAAGAITSAPFTMGHGAATMRAEMRVSRGVATDVGDGWALYLIEDSSPPFMGGIGSELGAPLRKTGFAVEWVFYRRSDGSQAENTGYLRQLRASSSDPILDTAANLIPRLNGTVSGPVNQRITVTITPDDVATAANETTLRAIIGMSGSLDCGPSTTPCPFRVRPGQRYRFGVSAGTGSWTANVGWSIFSTSAPRIALTDLCP